MKAMKALGVVALLSIGVTANGLAASPAHATPAETDSYERIAQTTIELREKEHIDPKAETPDHIVQQVLNESGSAGDKTGLRDSGGNYGTNIGRHEAAACATNPYDCKRAKSAIRDAERISSQTFPNKVTNDNIQDADRHCVWQALTTIRANADFARKIGDAHETDHPGSPEAGHMDQTNNAIGRDIGLRHEGDEAGAINECHAQAKTGGLIKIN